MDAECTAVISASTPTVRLAIARSLAQHGGLRVAAVLRTHREAIDALEWSFADVVISEHLRVGALAAIEIEVRNEFETAVWALRFDLRTFLRDDPGARQVRFAALEHALQEAIAARDRRNTCSQLFSAVG